jgi:flagellin
LLNEINRVAAQTVYNGAVVLDGSRDGTVTGGSSQKIQVGTDSGQSISFNVAAIDTDTLSLTAGRFAMTDSSTTPITGPVATDVSGQTGTISVATAAAASTSLGLVTTAIETVAGGRAELGAVSNRLEYTVSNLMNVAEYTTAARSRIEDADFAAESARLAKAQVLQQTGTAMLAQANASQQLALSLFR